MKRTPLYEEHVKLGARMVDFSGWELPVMYTSIIDEHTATRTSAGLFDVSHMGQISVKGKAATDYLRRLIPTDMGKLVPSKMMYSTFCLESGGVIDDLFIYMISDEDYYLVVNAGTIEKDFNWMKKNIIPNVEVENLSDKTAKIDIQGPNANKIMNKVISDQRLAALKRFFFDHFDYKGRTVLISQSGYTGEFGYEIYIDNDLAPVIWNEILARGKDFGISPAGLGARDSLRLESCYSLYGHELNENVTPVEAGIKWIVSSNDEYIGKKIISEQKKNGAALESIAFMMKGRGVPREGYKIFSNEEEIGHATSGGFGPTVGNGIGLALVKAGRVKTGDKITVLIRDRHIDAEVSPKPFYKYNG